MNFTRGFRQWAYVRGQAKDRYGATNHADEGLLARYRGNKDLIKAHLVNVQPQQPEGAWPTARTFKSAIAFVEQNYNRFGQLINTIDRLGLKENTLVVF